MFNFFYNDLKGIEILGGRKGGVLLMIFEYVLKEKGFIIGENLKVGNVNVRIDV